MSLRVTVLARLTSYSQHSSDTTCHTPFRKRGNEASIRVPRMFKSHAWQQYDGLLCRQRILDPKKISAMALNSTRPKHGTSLILYRGAVVMPRCSSKARSLPARIRDSAPKDSTSSASWYIFLGSVSLGGGCSSSVLSSVPWSSGCCSSAGES
jgi:hypothetical protein